MQSLSLQQILELVGTLDDSASDNNARHRFRKFLRDELQSVGQVRDYIEECLRNKGDQFDKALQDLVNHSASLLGFSVEYGRYRGVRGDIGFDGLWRWGDRTVVAEVKTTDAYSIDTSTVPNYVNSLISAGRVSDWDHTLGLYVFGRSDQNFKQLANSIIAEKRTDQLRIATIDDLLSLVELVQESLITTDEAVSLLWPGEIYVSGAVQLLARIASQTESPSRIATSDSLPTRDQALDVVELHANNEVEQVDRMYLITPVSDHGNRTAPEIIRTLLDAGWYVFGTRTAGRSELKPGDRICFYQSTVGVVADCEVASTATEQPPPDPALVEDPERFPWAFSVRNPRYFFENPTVLDAQLRSQLDAFDGRDPSTSWAWFVQGTRKISSHDFNVLTETAET